MSISSISGAAPTLQQLPAAATQASTDMQRALLSVAAAQSVQSAPMETLLSVLDVLGVGCNLDVCA